jgi:hypothetical protein
VQTHKESAIRRATQVAIGAGIAIALAVAGQARAEVLSASANGFEVRETSHVTAKAESVYAAIVAPSRWWDSAHTYSKSAANLTLDPRAGGCWCETLAGGGSVQQLTVVYAMPGRALRLRGALGPLQGLGVDGAMSWTISPVGGGSDLALTYTVGGYAKDGLDKLAGPVDGVLAAQLQRLKQFIETGSPDKTNHQGAIP